MNTKPDTFAESIRFGVELETLIPHDCGVTVGGYHSGTDVVRGTYSGVGIRVTNYAGCSWKAERDGSIRPVGDLVACEFVSPILKGCDGVNALLEFLKFASFIHANVNASCGCHVTVNVADVTAGTALAFPRFIQRLARLVKAHERAIYAQTGTNRHVNTYSLPLKSDAGEITNKLLRPCTNAERDMALGKLGRGIVNFKKMSRSEPLVEFRAFAGTLNPDKVLHHVATAIGLCRRAAVSATVPPYADREQPSSTNALLRLWEYLGWTGGVPGTPCAFGQFGPLHTQFGTYQKTALRLAAKFQANYVDSGKPALLEAALPHDDTPF